MIVDRFLAYIRTEKRYSENTVRSYGRDLRRFFADTGIGADIFDPMLLTPDDIRKWIMSLGESGLSAASVNRMISTMRAFVGWLRKTGQTDVDPFVKISFQRKPFRLPVYIPIAKMTEVVGDSGPEEMDFEQQRNALIIVVFYSTGIRLAELVGIKIDDFTPGYAELRVRGKGNKERVVPLISYTRKKISEYRERIKRENIWNGSEKSLFLSRKGLPLGRAYIYRIVREQLTRAGVQGKRSPHVLRHTFATHMLDYGADIREIQEILGHSSLSATQIYTHNSIAKLKEAYGHAHPRGRDKLKGSDNGDQ